MRHLLLSLLGLIATTASAGEISVTVSGLHEGDHATLSVASNEYIANLTVTAPGDYTMAGVPAGTHAVKIEAAGYESVPSVSVSVAPGAVPPVRFTLEKMEADPSEWSYSWSNDDSPAGYTTTSYVNTPPEIEFLGEQIVPADVPYFAVLYNNHNILLDDSGEKWTQEHAYRLVETLKTLSDAAVSRPVAKFILTDELLADDIDITDAGGGYVVRISAAAFAYANPFLVNLDGVKGRFFSKRLHHAMVNFVTDYGRDTAVAERILRERFGCSITGFDYGRLTAATTGEEAEHFQPFVPQELVYIINMLEEMPEGFHKVSGLKYLLRRINGMEHPINPNALAVAWPEEPEGYIEFMEEAFNGEGTQTHAETLRIVIHEKAHFMWEHLFSDEIKQAWIELGGWYEDPDSQSGWSTTKEVEFVSAYAHQKNPNEDMAESIAFYLNNPEKLMSRSLPKYEFIRDRIMHGVRYVSTIPDHLTFEVLNLYPDYDYPGRVEAVDIKVTGAPDEDKTVDFQIELLDMDGFNDSASDTRIKLMSPRYRTPDGEETNTQFWVSLHALDAGGHLFGGRTIISRYAKTGYWTISEIVLTDHAGNQRFEGENNMDAVIYVNNPGEDLTPPVYEKGSLRCSTEDVIVDGHKAQRLHIEASVTDNIGVRDVVAVIQAGERSYSNNGTGRYDAATGKACYDILITEFHPSGEYIVRQIEAFDAAGNRLKVMFSEHEGDEPEAPIYITTPNPDSEAPEIDLNRILVYAEPTHPEAPDGETKVTIHFYARDDKSGFRTCRWVLRDPQGIEHYEWFYNHRNIYTTFFDGDPTLWERYTINCILPPGSAPGIWGLAELTPYDKVDNFKTYNFVETIIFDPDIDESDYELYAEIDRDGMVSLSLSDAAGEVDNYTYRIIHEESGTEISGASGDSAAAMARAARFKAVGGQRGTTVDASSLPDGELIVIVTAFDKTDGSVTAVRNARLTKGIAGSVADIEADADTPVDVINLQGIVVRRAVPFGRWAESLPEGVYIVGGRKLHAR